MVLKVVEDNFKNADDLKNGDNLKNKDDLKNENNLKYQPSGPGGTRSPPEMLHHLQHRTACLIQNGRRV